MITHRVLPPDEWRLVAHREPFASGGLPNPEIWRIVVVERDGAIIGMCSLFDSPHWDVWSIDEAERGNPVVFKELVEGGVEVMDEYSLDLVHTTIPLGRDDLGAMLERFGFTPADGELYVFRRSR